MRLLLRLAAAFVLDLLIIYRDDRDFIDALIIATLMQRKAARISGDAERQRRHAFFDTPAREDDRGPISINALAASLDLPFETARRRVKRLIADGICELRPDGVRFSAERIGSESELRDLEAAYETARALYSELQRNDCITWMDLRPQRNDSEFGDGPPVRIVWRIAADYFLRMVEVFQPGFPNPTQAFILLEVIRANTTATPDEMRGEDRPDAEALAPDAFRQPVRVTEVARRLKLPEETVRRQISALAAGGHCVRVRGGVIAPREVFARATMVAAMVANLQNLRRMFMDLANTGVLTRWDAELQATRRGVSCEPRLEDLS